MTSRREVRGLLLLVVLMTSRFNLVTSYKDQGAQEDWQMSQAGGDDVNDDSSPSSSSSTSAATAAAQTTAGESEGGDDDDDDGNEDDVAGAVKGQQVMDGGGGQGDQPEGTREQLTSQGSLPPPAWAEFANEGPPILTMTVAESLTTTAQHLVFFHTEFERWFYKLCSFGYVSITMEVNPSGVVTGNNTLIVGGKEPQAPNNYMCSLDTTTSASGARNLTCVQQTKMTNCRDWKSWSCVTPVLNNTNGPRCLFDRFGIVWTQTVTVVMADTQRLQLQQCDNECDVTTASTPDDPVSEWMLEHSGDNNSWRPSPEKIREHLNSISGSKKNKDDDDEDPSIYIYIGVGVAASGVLLALTVIVIVCCVIKRRDAEKEKMDPLKDGVPNPAFSPVVQVSPQNSVSGAQSVQSDASARGASGKTSDSGHQQGAAGSSGEHESLYDYIDDAYFSRVAGYSKLRDDTKYSHEYNALHRSHTTSELASASNKLMESPRPRYSLGAAYERSHDYLASQCWDGSGQGRYVAPPTAIRSAPPTIVRGGARRKHVDEDVYAVANHQEEGDAYQSAGSVEGEEATPTRARDHAPDSYLDLSFDPNLDRTATTPGLDRTSTLELRPRGQSQQGQRLRPLVEAEPPMPYHSYLEVLAPLPETRPPLALRGQGRASLPTHPSLSVAESLGPQPPLPRRNATFHYYSQPEPMGPASLEE